MKIDFNYHGSDALNFFSTLDLPLHMAKKFLETIPNQTPNEPNARVEFEMAVEGFLLFIIVARERLLQEINRKLPNPLEKDNVSVGNLLKKLANNSDQNFQKIHIMINDATQSPQQINNSQSQQTEWDRQKSWLTELNILRNQIGHRNASNQAIYRGGGPDKSMMIICVDHLKIEIEEPRRYFDDCFVKFEKLKNDIRALLNLV